MEKKKDEERKWLIQLIDDSYALVFASTGGHFGVVKRILVVLHHHLFGHRTPMCLVFQIEKDLMLIVQYLCKNHHRQEDQKSHLN